MTSNREIRRESLARTFAGRWFWRMLLVTMLVGFVNNLANELVDVAYRECQVQTWADYFVAKVQAMQSGMDYAVPSRAVAMQMNYATAFSAFIAFIFGGIMMFGVTCVVLKNAKDDESGWCRDSMGGFARPLGVAWLGFVLAVRVALWSLLLVVPGVVATYRYSQCWNLKVEHPDWGAAKCLGESSRMMEGRKMQRFFLDLYFVGLAVALCVAMLAFIAVFAAGGMSGLVEVLALMAATPCLVVLGLWMSVARAVFYRELKASSASERVSNGHCEVH